MRQINVVGDVEVDAPADQVWSILVDDFYTAHEWSSSITSITPHDTVAGGRYCEVPGFGTTDERITLLDREKMTLVYSIEASEVPHFVEDTENEWIVADIGGDRSRISSRVSATVTGNTADAVAPQLEQQMRATQGAVLADFKVFAETGEMSEAKAALKRSA